MNVAAVLADPSYPELKELVLEHTALYYYSEKDEDLAARLARRMTAREAKDCSAYLRILRRESGQGAEWDALVGEITIGETYFFRQSEHFDFLRTTVIPDILRRNRESRTLRIWSAGCATGAEPYSIAVLLRMHFAQVLLDWQVSILATDINTQFLAQARSGKFGEWALRRLPDSVRDCCFRRSGAMWELSAEYRRQVRFEYHNLASASPYPGSTGEPLDLIFCRNVLIYFSGDRIREVAKRFYDALAPNGWLLVGHAEPSSVNFPQFETVSEEGTSAYRKGSGETCGVVAPAACTRPVLDLNAWPFVPDPPAEAVPPVRVSRRVPPKVDVAAAAGDADSARAYADRGDWANAERICRDVIDRSPLDAAAHFTLGLILEHKGAEAEAEGSFRRAIYLDRAFALAHYHLALALRTRGIGEAADRALRNTLDLLRSQPDDQPVPHGDGILVGELRDLANMHLELSR